MCNKEYHENETQRREKYKIKALFITLLMHSIIDQTVNHTLRLMEEQEPHMCESSFSVH